MPGKRFDRDPAVWPTLLLVSHTGRPGEERVAAAISRRRPSQAGGRRAVASCSAPARLLELAEVSELEASADVHHRRAPRMDRADGLLDIDPL